MMNNSNYQNASKKIKPVEHPDLVLKSPIAYHGGTDLSVIPIDKDGIAVCEKCGAIGVKHAFYTKQRKFCSLTCARGYTGMCNMQKENNGFTNDGNLENQQEELIPPHHHRKQANYKFKLMETTDHLVGMIPMEPLPQLPGMWQPAIDDFMRPTHHKTGNLGHTYEWQNELSAYDYLAAPVKQFSHAPLWDIWGSIFEGMKVEVKNRDCDNFSYKLSDYFWVATVLKLKGYMGLLRYEGFGNDDSKDFWVNLMHSEVHPVGWCATRGKPLITPQTIVNKYSDWKTFLEQRLSGGRTLPTNFYTKISESLKSRFRIGHILEVVDKNRICQVKVATVHEIVGKRLHIRYYDSTPEDNGFWCHEDCPLIHPVGWAHEVGHILDAPVEYLDRLKENIADQDDATPELFKRYLKKDPHNINYTPEFIEGMKLEAIDPLNLSSICVATVMKVLLHGYIMIRIDCYPPDESGSDWFCYHNCSPCIFPLGFCNERGIPLIVSTGQAPVPIPPLLNLHLEPPQHEFVPGMRLECADLMDPRLVCVATIAGVVGRLLKVHFNGWGDEYDQWLDCESTDIYPVGWCQAVGHKLEGPFVPPARQPAAPPRKKGRKKKAVKPPIEQQKTSHLEPICDISSREEGLYEMLSTSKSDDNFNMESSNMEEVKDDSPIDEILKSRMLDESELDAGNQPDDSHIDFDLEMNDKQNYLGNENNESLDNSDLNMDTSSTNGFVGLELEPRIPKTIPRLVGNATPVDSKTMEAVDPESWDPEDVAQFLLTNDCAPYCMNFCEINGKLMLELTKDQIIELLDMKVGPSLKIYDLIQQLKCKLKPVHARSKAFK